MSLKIFRNRETTKDIDFVLAPGQPNREKVLEKMQEAIIRVADKHNLVQDWMNNNAEGIVLSRVRNTVFANSIDQDYVLFKGNNLIVYAAPMDFMLARKLSIIARGNPRSYDLSDAAYAQNYLNRQRGELLTRDEIRAYCTGRDKFCEAVITDEAVKQLDDAYKEIFNEEGLTGE